MCDVVVLSVQEQLKRIDALQEDMDRLDKRLACLGKDNQHMLAVQAIPGIGPLTATALVARATDCQSCPCKKQCLKGPMKPNDGRGRQVTRFEPKPKDLAHPSERMRQAIDSPRGRQLYSQRFGTVEPVFGNIRHNKRLIRLNHRGHAKVGTQWSLYCMVHNIEKLAKTSLGQHSVQ